MFLVLGNGYQWLDGRLGILAAEHDSFEAAIAKMMMEGRPDPEIWSASREHMAAIDRSLFDGWQDSVLTKALERTAMRQLPPNPEPFTYTYPLCEFSILVNIPENIRADWWKLWREALEIARDYPSYSPESLEDHPDRARKQQAKHLQWADMAEKRAKEFGLFKKFGGGISTR
jgi:hypothetical protein